ncbi:MAG: hypothetical protein ABIV47_06095 [Roseiflexaceae bacterium]
MAADDLKKTKDEGRTGSLLVRPSSFLRPSSFVVGRSSGLAAQRAIGA